MKIYFIIALRNLIQAKRRTLLLGLALSTVTLLLVLLLSWSNGIADTMVRSATALSSGHVNVAGWITKGLDGGARGYFPKEGDIHVAGS